MHRATALRSPLLSPRCPNFSSWFRVSTSLNSPLSKRLHHGRIVPHGYHDPPVHLLRAFACPGRLSLLPSWHEGGCYLALHRDPLCAPSRWRHFLLHLSVASLPQRLCRSHRLRTDGSRPSDANVCCTRWPGVSHPKEHIIMTCLRVF
jgi:hypothetical protein